MATAMMMVEMTNGIMAGNGMELPMTGRAVCNPCHEMVTRLNAPKVWFGHGLMESCTLFSELLYFLKGCREIGCRELHR